MKSKRKFLRQCACCKKYNDKKNLIRITKDYKTGLIKLNNNNEIIGRSIYLCKNKECIDNALKKKRIQTVLKAELSKNIEDKLYTVLKN